MENRKFKAGLFMLPLLTQGGGAEKYFIDLARNLRDRGIEADVITMDEKFFRRFARALHIFALGNFLGKIDTSGREKEDTIRQQLGKAQWIKTNLKNLGRTLRNYDVIYSKNELVELIFLKLVGSKKLPPIIVGVHTPINYPETKSLISKLHNFLYSGFIYRWLLRGAKCVHICNSSTKYIIENKFKLNSKLVFYPFSTQNIFESARNYKFNINFDCGKKNIIFLGRLSEQKGFRTLVNIIGEIDENQGLKEKICLNIFGSGDKEYENKLKDISEEVSFVRYFGHIENKFIPDILSQQDLMIAPSKWETLPFAVLEAQSLGVPVIAFDIPGPGDIIMTGKTGFLVKSEKEFIEKIRDFAQEKINFEKVEIVQNIKNKFHPDKIYPQLLDLFRENI